jgi:hypothetical protein
MTALDERPMRALPGMDGAIHHGETGAIVADRVIDEATYNVTLDVTDQVDWLALFRAIANDVRLRESARILMHNQGRTLTGRGLLLEAANDFRRDASVRAAFTLTVGPSQAEELAEHLAELVIEPARCEAREGDCSNYVEDDKSYEPFSGKHMCPMHLAMAQGD